MICNDSKTKGGNTPIIERTRKLIWFTAVALSVLLGCREPVVPTGGNYRPVTSEMLSGAQFINHTNGDRFDDMQWTFSESNFEIVAGKNGIPDDICAALLPPDVDAKRITGDWVVINQLITFSNIEADGVATDQDLRTLPTMFTGVLRIQGARQYVFERK